MLSDVQRASILDRAIQPYLCAGWILQSRSTYQAQLLKKAHRYGCLMRILFALILLFFPRYDKLLLITVGPDGVVSKQERRQ